MSGTSTATTIAAPALLAVRCGRQALGALGGAIRAAQRLDALAPVTVVVPSSHVAVSVRRHLARLTHRDGRAGLVNVSWLSLPQLAEQLAAGSLVADDRPPLTGVISRAALRAALDEAPGRFAPVVDNASTERRLELTFAELRSLDDHHLDALAAASGRSRDLVRLFRLYRERCTGFADEREAIDRAAAAAAPADGRGSTVVYLPTRLSPPERDLLRRLAATGPLTVLLGLVGDDDADRATRALGAQLGHDLGVELVDLPAREGEVIDEAPPVFVRAPDPDEEARLAVRRVLAAIEDGLAPDDLAIVSRVSAPYTLLLHEHLQVAGVPHYAPAATSLAQSVAGRALLGFLGVAERGFRRAELFRWVRSAPIRDRDGAIVPRRFDNHARRAGVARGLDQWHQRLDRLRADYERDGERRDRDLEELDALRRFVDDLAALATPPAEATWRSYAAWATTVIDQVLGGRAHTRRWPDAEQASLDQVRAVIAELAALDPVQPRVDPDRFRRVLEQELDRPNRAVGSFGHGVFVGRVGDLAGARHELIVVVGMAEGQFPPKGQDDALLPDAERRVLDGALDDRRPSRADEKRAFLAALAAAPRRCLSFARVDAGGQHEAMPSRLYLRELGAVLGRHVGFDELDALAALAGPDLVPVGATRSGPAVFQDTSSFQAGVLAAEPALSTQEQAVAALLTGAALEGVPDGATLARGREAVVARVAGDFSVWTGDAGPLNAPRFEGARVGSSTSFEQWATCPFRYFLGHVLNVRPLDAYADADAISGLDRGSLVHEVLERFIGEHEGRAADAAWLAADQDRLRDIAHEVADRYEGEGRTGRPLLWQLELESLVRRLETILDIDAAERARADVEPIAVEFVFGSVDGGAPPVEFTLASGRVVSFRGAIDRVDRDPDDGRLVVLDYKTGKDRGYREIAEGIDITCRGRHLQLVIYAEAARQHFGGDLVEAYYWFVEQKSSRLRLGAPIDDAHRRRFLDVLGVIVGGIEAGRFPANPGEPNFFGFSHCGFCDFDRICPSTRDDLWEGVRLSGRLADYVELAEPGGDDG
jgi:hypothetical protein